MAGADAVGHSCSHQEEYSRRNQGSRQEQVCLQEGWHESL